MSSEGTAGTGPGDAPLDATPYSAGKAIGFGWRSFWAKPSTLLVPVIFVVVVLIVVELLIQFIVGGGFSGNSNGFWRQWLGLGLGTALMTLVVNLLGAGLFRGALNVTEGKPFSVGEMFEGWNKGQVVAAAFLIAFATFIGTVVCLLPGILIWYSTTYTLFFIVDQEFEAVEAIQGSVKLVWGNFGHTLAYFILGAILLAVGALLCGVGLLVALPVFLIGMAYTYRRLRPEPYAD
jgi:uncharacterized membrane protein